DLDYMHARYYSPVVGRFLSIDPGRDWNAREPQSWNLFSYARNNPLRYVDPDGRLNYEALLFGQKVPVRVDDRLSKKQQLALKKKLDAALHKLNSGKALTKEEVATIRNVKSIAVDGSARRSSILESTGAFTLIPGDVRDSSASFLGSSLAHDAKHVELFQQGGLRLSRGLGAEVDAMKFQLQVGEKIGISSEEAGYLRDLIRDPKRLEQYIWTSP
ncbi:MAG TPA: RHS repeat-associated core domain-containing protein, partial [Thermoanaerobaculia bacterium]|nr:RHS repeat-associated core domain-containing protein [Thermoanaerobaculia bacterium]